MLRGSARVARPSFPLISFPCAAPSEASNDFTQDRQSCAKFFCPWRTRAVVSHYWRRQRGALQRLARRYAALFAMPVLRHRELSLRRNCLARTGVLGRRSFGQSHPDQLAHPAFLHGDAVKNVGLGNGTLIA